MVEKDYKDVQTFSENNQLDLLDMLTNNLEDFEKSCAHLRLLLKNPILHQEMEAKEKKEKK